MEQKKSFLLFFLLVFTTSVLRAQEKVETRFFVAGVCDMCKERIEKATDVKGVIYSEWDASKQELFLVYRPDEISVDSVHARIQKVGHDTQKGKADDKDYKSVHSCCRYRDPEVTDKHRKP